MAEAPSLAAENARLTMLLHEQLGVVRAMEKHVSELGARWDVRRSEYEAQIRKLEEKVRELELQLSVARAVAASAHGDTPPALPMVEAVPIEKPKPMYTPCTAPPTIPLPCDGPRFTAEGWGMSERLEPPGPPSIPLVPPLDGPNATNMTDTPTPPLPAAAAESGLRRRKRSDPDVMIADALTRPPALDAPLTTDDVLATLGL